MKRIVNLFVTFAIIFVIATSSIACGKKPPVEEINPDAQVVKVNVYKAGYGIDWLESARQKFNDLFGDEYFIKIEKADGAVPDTIEVELLDVTSNDVDLYFGAAINIPAYIERSKSVLRRDDKILIEDLTPVYQSKPIKFDGTEEDITIENKLIKTAKPFYVFNDVSGKYSNFANKYYSFPWASGPAGLFANKNVLEENNLEIPRTTDELYAQYSKLMQTAEDGGAYPIIYAGQNAPGYGLYTYDTWVAQYSGYEKERELWNIKVTPEGKEIYNDEGMLKALEVYEKIFDDDFMIRGANGLSNEQAQAQLLNGEALYMSTGNWFYNEMKKNFKEKVNNAIIIKMPIISALGTKLGITDAKLSAIVKAIDDGLNNDAIVNQTGKTLEIVERIREARNVYFNGSADHSAIIPSYADGKEGAKKFLRFLASDDFLDEYKNTTNSSLPFNYLTSSKYTPNSYEQSVIAISGNPDSLILSEDKYTSPIRRKANLQIFGNVYYPETFKAITMGNKTPASVIEEAKNYVLNNWDAILRMA